MEIKQVSSLEKIRNWEIADISDEQTVLAGERFSYQLWVNTTEPIAFTVSLTGELAEYAAVYRVRDAVLDTPMVVPVAETDDYLTRQPGLMPDILEPTDKLYSDKVPAALWIRVDVPRDMKPGKYSLIVALNSHAIMDRSDSQVVKTMTFTVLPVVKPEQKLIYTRWLYLDCIATAHNAEIFSEYHWQMIERYIAAATDMGINMLLVPVHTPPLDTEIGTARPCVQLVDIEKRGDTYHFDFEKFHRYIALCKKYGIRYYEIAHMFTQWGAKSTPNILVTENGQTSYRFGWHVAADSDEYVAFLKQYITAISQALQAEGISENTYFHISDEPAMDTMQTYKTAAEIIRPLIGNSKTLDALSDYAFYEKGLVECPVTIINKIHEFLEHEVPDQWLYYCCGPTEVYCNSFMALPSYRVRILGLLLYRYNIRGLLHWGFNFYNACRSLYPIDPYLTTSGDGAYPSGDPFVVYPGKDCVYPSIRGELIREAVQDMDILYALEAKIGREAVVAMLDHAAGGELRFDRYPKGNEFLLSIRQEILKRLGE